MEYCNPTLSCFASVQSHVSLHADSPSLKDTDERFLAGQNSAHESEEVLPSRGGHEVSRWKAQLHLALSRWGFLLLLPLKYDRADSLSHDFVRKVRQIVLVFLGSL